MAHRDDDLSRRQQTMRTLFPQRHEPLRVVVELPRQLELGVEPADKPRHRDQLRTRR